MVLSYAVRFEGACGVWRGRRGRTNGWPRSRLGSCEKLSPVVAFVEIEAAPCAFSQSVPPASSART